MFEFSKNNWVVAIKDYNSSHGKENRVNISGNKPELKENFISQAGKRRVAYYLAKTQKFKITVAATLAAINVVGYKAIRNRLIEGVMDTLWVYKFWANERTELKRLVSGYSNDLLKEIGNQKTNSQQVFLLIWDYMPEVKDYLLDSSSQEDKEDIIGKHYEYTEVVRLFNLYKTSRQQVREEYSKRKKNGDKSQEIESTLQRNDLRLYDFQNEPSLIEDYFEHRRKSRLSKQEFDVRYVLDRVHSWLRDKRYE